MQLRAYTRDSYVSYRHSRILETAKIVKGVESGVFVAKELMDKNIVDRICEGLDFHQTPEKMIKRFFRMYIAQ